MCSIDGAYSYGLDSEIDFDGVQYLRVITYVTCQ